MSLPPIWRRCRRMREPSRDGSPDSSEYCRAGESELAAPRISTNLAPVHPQVVGAVRSAGFSPLQRAKGWSVGIAEPIPAF